MQSSASPLTSASTANIPALGIVNVSLVFLDDFEVRLAHCGDQLLEDERFDVRVHPRSIERALARREAADRSPKSG
jgi:hypothetical protein